MRWVPTKPEPPAITILGGACDEEVKGVELVGEGFACCCCCCCCIVGQWGSEREERGEGEWWRWNAQLGVKVQRCLSVKRVERAFGGSDRESVKAGGRMLGLPCVSLRFSFLHCFLLLSPNQLYLRAGR